MSEEQEFEDRRKFDRDHDLLTKIHTLVEGMDKNFASHMEQDKKDFDTVHKRINGLTWYVAMGVGGIAAIELALKFISK